MVKNIFKNNPKSYLLVAAAGLLAGLLVAFFSGFPSEGLWAFAYFGSSTVGFWIFTASCLVLLSEKRLTAMVNTAIYVYLMFTVTGAYKYIRDYARDAAYFKEDTAWYLSVSGYGSMSEYILDCLLNIFLYGAVPALTCALLALVLHFGRKQNVMGRIILCLPVLCILSETVYMYITLFTEGTMLFMAIVDTLCLAGYILLFGKYIIKKS